MVHEEFCDVQIDTNLRPHDLAPSPENPFHDCPDEILDITRIGSPSIDALPMIPHDFVILGTHERPTVKETRVMIGIRIRTPGPKAFYACIAGRWALFAPELL